MVPPKRNVPTPIPIQAPVPKPGVGVGEISGAGVTTTSINCGAGGTCRPADRKGDAPRTIGLEANGLRPLQADPLGSDFVSGKTYTVVVNKVAESFVAQ